MPVHSYTRLTFSQRKVSTTIVQSHGVLVDPAAIELVPTVPLPSERLVGLRYIPDKVQAPPAGTIHFLLDGSTLIGQVRLGDVYGVELCFAWSDLVLNRGFEAGDNQEGDPSVEHSDTESNSHTESVCDTGSDVSSSEHSYDPTSSPSPLMTRREESSESLLVVTPTAPIPMKGVIKICIPGLRAKRSLPMGFARDLSDTEAQDAIVREAETYNKLVNLQGSIIPRCLGYTVSPSRAAFSPSRLMRW